MNRTFYDNERAINISEQKTIHKRNKQITLARIIIFVLMIISFAAGYDGYSYCYQASLVFLIIFVKLVSYHDSLKQRSKFLKSRMLVQNSYISRAKGTWRTRYDDGEEYLSRPQDIDLHIFGEGSIFQYICSARTKRGRDRLAESLSPNPPKDFQNVRSRQKGVAELLNRPRLSLDLEAYGRLLPENHNTTELIELIEKPITNLNPIYNLRFVALPLFLLMLAMNFNVLAENILRIAVVPLTSLIISLIFLRRTSEILKPLQTVSNELKLYEEIFKRIEETEFNSKCLIKISDTLKNEVSAHKELQRLSRLIDIVKTRQNPIFFILGNGLFLLDFFCVVRFVKLNETLSKHVRQWIDTWSEMEVLLSLASIGQSRTIYCFPNLLEDESPKISSKKLSSLLIADQKAIANDVELNAGTTIITGSNMSGKTTWIRTLASAVVLSYAGAPVCAEEFSVSKLSIFTSIRVNDDLSQGMSTFYAELLRIKSMIEFSEKHLPMLICIDEIFKGTNSADRIVGAKEAIKRLTNDWSITLVTTHDFELCELPNITNSHFEEYYVDNEIKFDFKLKEGRCHTTNAKYLLKMAGII